MIARLKESLQDLQMPQSLREEREGKLQILLSPRKNSLTSLFKEVRVSKGRERVNNYLRFSSQRKTKGQQLKGKIVSALSHTFLGTFPHIFPLFRIFPPGLFLSIKGFYYCFSSKRRKENKREEKRRKENKRE